jgi:protein-disulfide isomerase
VGVCLTGLINLNGQAVPSDKSAVVAEVNGEKLTFGDLEQQEGGQLLQARYQYYTSQRKALDQLIDEKLLEIHARSKGLTVDQLLDQEVYGKIKDPTDDQLQVYYEGLETSEPFDAVKDRVLEHIRELRHGKARGAYVAELKKQAVLQVMLEAPSAMLNVKDAYLRGPKNAPVTLVEFADYECPYCQKVKPDLQRLQAEYGNKLAIVYKDFPLPMHHRAQKAAEAARCAGEQGKFWEFNDVLFYSKQLDINNLKEHAHVLKLDEQRFNKCLDDGAETAAVKKDLEEGKHLGLSGTPSFFVNGHFISGAVEYGALKEMVDQQLAVAQNSPVPPQTGSALQQSSKK